MCREYPWVWSLTFQPPFFSTSVTKKATIYCPNGNPSLRLFRMINALSKQVIFLGDFNSKHKQFGCVKPNKSGQTLVNIATDLQLFYVNQLDP